jgi:hypothetical protein
MAVDIDDERIEWPGDPRPARPHRRPPRTTPHRARRRRPLAAAAQGDAPSPPPVDAVSQTHGRRRDRNESGSPAKRPDRQSDGRPLGVPNTGPYVPEGDDGTLVLRQPWRFDDRNKLDGQGQSPAGGNPRYPLRDYSRTPARSDPAKRDKFRPNAKLIAKARALGLPVLAYDNTLSLAIRRMRGGREQFVGFLTLAAEAGDEDAKKFVQVFSELNAHDQREVTLDVVCITAGVSRVGLLKSVVEIGFENQVDVGKLVEVSTLPSLVDRAIESAMRLDSTTGQRDRMAILQHHGLMPAPKSTVIHVTAAASAQAAAGASSEPRPSVPNFLQDVDVAAASRDVVQHAVVDAGVEGVGDRG